jgi:hypothetical protein
MSVPSTASRPLGSAQDPPPIVPGAPALVRQGARRPLRSGFPPAPHLASVAWPKRGGSVRRRPSYGNGCSRLSNLPADSEPERLARLARLRWKIALDYKQLKGELGLDHYEGRSWLGWHHHTALVTAAHGFLTLERLTAFRRRPA